MILCDVNVLIRAHKEGADRHDEYRVWLEDAMNGGRHPVRTERSTRRPGVSPLADLY